MAQVVSPIDQNDANTRAVFGEYVSVYDIQQYVMDKATVPIYHECRIAKLSLNEAELPKVDSEFEEITEGEEEDRKQKFKNQVCRVGSTRRQRVADSPDRGRPGPTLRAATAGEGRSTNEEGRSPDGSVLSSIVLSSNFPWDIRCAGIGDVHR